MDSSAITSANLYFRLSIIFGAVATISVVLRLIAHLMSASSFGHEDFLIIVALLFLIGLTVNCKVGKEGIIELLLTVTAGFLFVAGGADGTPYAELSPERIVTLQKVRKTFLLYGTGPLSPTANRPAIYRSLELDPASPFISLAFVLPKLISS